MKLECLLAGNLVQYQRVHFISQCSAFCIHGSEILHYVGPVTTLKAEEEPLNLPNASTLALLKQIPSMIYHAASSG